MLSQKSVRLEQLDLVKPRYNKLEKALWLITQARVWIAAASQLYVVIIIFTLQERFFYVVMI